MEIKRKMDNKVEKRINFKKSIHFSFISQFFFESFWYLVKIMIELLIVSLFEFFVK